MESKTEQVSGMLIMRAPLAIFSQAMEQQLRANDHKGGWETCGDWWLQTRVDQKADTIGQLLVDLQEINSNIAMLRKQSAGFTGTLEEGQQLDAGFARLAQKEQQTRTELTRLCADAANYLMMIASNYGRNLPVGEAL